MSGDVVDKLDKIHNKVLLEEFYRLKQELSNQHYLAAAPEKIARFNELKKQLKTLNSVRAFEKAKERIKRQFISWDNSSDNSVRYTVITKFKKTNE